MMKRLLVIGLFCITLGSAGLAQKVIPKLEQTVTDFTNTLTYVEWNELQTLIKNFEDSTSTQIAVLLIGSVQGESIDGFSILVFEKNKIGQKSKDNGVLIVVAKDDRLVRIEVGYGLEGVLTDAATSQIIEREMKPQFIAGNYFDGLSKGVAAIMGVTAGEYHVEGRGQIAPTVAVTMLLGFVVLFMFVFLPMIASRRKYVIGSGDWYYHSGWGAGSSGFGGGSFGGGWSGGGGMAGGGGATGRW